MNNSVIGKFSFFAILFLVISISSCIDDEPNDKNLIPVISTLEVSILEGDDFNVASVVVELNKTSEETISVDFHTSDGSAIAVEDYFAKEGKLVFEPGFSTLVIDVSLVVDTIKEQDESFFIDFSNPIGAKLSKGQVEIKILNDDEFELDTTTYNYPGYITGDRDGYVLLWSDEFDGNTLNEDYWSYDLGDGCPNICGWGNNEKEYYRKENAVVSKDLLTITAKKESFGGRQYTSSRIKTIDKFFFTHGRVDIRVRLPYGKGIWPALWMMGNNKSDVGWPACGEIDMMELRGSKPHKSCATLHYKNSSGNHSFPIPGCYTLTEGDYSDEFHVFSIIWTDEKVSWYMNDQHFLTVVYPSLNLPSGVNPFQKDFYFLMNVAVGGNYDGEPNADTSFPQTMEIDYIRVFQEE